MSVRREFDPPAATGHAENAVFGIHGFLALALVAAVGSLPNFAVFVNFRAHVISLILLVPSGATAAWQDEIGFTRLKLLAGAELPTAPANGFSQIEALEGGNYTPDSGNALFTGKTFSTKSGVSGTSTHATRVATNFYGTTSQQSGSCQVDLYEASNWLNSGFLNRNIDSEPKIEARDVQNHSWVGTINDDVEVGRRLDFAINRDGFVCVVGLHNEAAINPLPGLLGQTYNTISVGRDDGNHSRGPTTLDGTGRAKPDIVAPSSAPEYATSWTTPMVAGAAGLLYAKLENDYAVTGAHLPRVIKALLLASATKNTLPGWTNNLPASPLNPIYGAGELNIHHAYSTLRTGRAAASNSTLRKHRGWAAESVSNNSEKNYFFNIPAGAPTTPFCAAITWHRLSTKSGSNNWSSSLTNLSLRLHNASGFTVGTQIAESNSAVDNVELIYQANLPPGNYALVVDNPPLSSATPYALAWHSLPAVTVAATISIAKEIDGQAGQVTITRSGDTTLPLLVPLTVSGTAVSGTHFQPLPASVTIPAGQVSSTVAVTPIADFLAQGSRTVIVAVAADFTLVRDAAQTALVTIQDKPFDAWRFNSFTPLENTTPSISGETADPDGDELANLIEYALGLAPKTPNASPLTLLDLDGYLTISTPQNTAATDITWGAQVCDDISTWNSNVTTSSVANIFTARDNVLMNSTDKRFIRLKISRP